VRAISDGKSRAAPHVAVVGGGFSGAMTAYHLLKAGGCRVTLIEQRGRAAAGAAYSTEDEAHLLNVRAANMSALPDAPGHFAEWLERQGGGDGASFAQRRLYHRYIAELLEQQDRDGRITVVRGAALALTEAGGRLALSMADGSEIAADRVVLASGNLPARRPPLAGEPGLIEERYVADPWSADGRAAVAGIAGIDGDVLLLGTGLTMVDMCLSLTGAGFGGRIVATSRRGLIPHGHAPFEPRPLAEPPAGRLAELLRETRARARAVGWRAAVDALRPYSIDLWRGFTLAERKRFLRHLRPYWDVHRHRIAPAVAQRLEQLRTEDRLEIVPGRVAGLARKGEAMAVTIRRRGGGGDAVREVAAVINCTGPSGDIAGADDALVAQLLASGMARPDPLRLGFEVDENSRVIAADGSVRGNLFAVGPITKGCFWEIVAVPDIRMQVQAAAAEILRAGP
jgi:uncharacterized NAD(P)/FAD-binding protein YdhS